MHTNETTNRQSRVHGAFRSVAGLASTVVSSAMAIGVVAALSMASVPAQAQQLCLLRDVAVSQLTKQHGEEISARGLATDGKFMMELFTGERGSWTLITTDVNGRSCVVASGEAWSPVPVVPGDPA